MGDIWDRRLEGSRSNLYSCKENINDTKPSYLDSVLSPKVPNDHRPSAPRAQWRHLPSEYQGSWEVEMPMDWVLCMRRRLDLFSYLVHLPANWSRGLLRRSIPTWTRTWIPLSTSLSFPDYRITTASTPCLAVWTLSLFTGTGGNQLCCDLMRNAPHMVMYLDVWFLVGCVVWEIGELKGQGALLKELSLALDI